MKEPPLLKLQVNMFFTRDDVQDQFGKSKKKLFMHANDLNILVRQLKNKLSCDEDRKLVSEIFNQRVFNKILK